MLLQLWHRPAAVASVQFLAWEIPYATGATLKKKRHHKNDHVEFLLWLGVVTIPTSIHEDMGLIPGLNQWGKDLVLP